MNADDLPPVKLFVNVSGVQLEFSNFSSKIAEALQRSGLPPNRLELEITESWIISDLQGAAAKLQVLRDLGIGIAIDDFGTGHATFSYLQALPLDMLKIDRSFVHDLQGSSVNLSTVRAITGLAQQLGLKTVAEGVESEHELKELNKIGCDLVQGSFSAGRSSRKPPACCSSSSRQARSSPRRSLASAILRLVETHDEYASPRITGIRVIPVAGRDSMLLNLSGAHAPFFTRNVLLLSDSAGHRGAGEVPGGEKIRLLLEESPRRDRRAPDRLVPGDPYPHPPTLRRSRRSGTRLGDLRPANHSTRSDGD